MAGRGIGSVQSNEATSVGVIGMRYKIIDAESTEQVAQGYTEEKMEVGAKVTGITISQEQFDFARKRIFEQGLAATVDWYLGNPGWVARVLDGAASTVSIATAPRSSRPKLPVRFW